MLTTKKRMLLEILVKKKMMKQRAASRKWRMLGWTRLSLLGCSIGILECDESNVENSS